MLNYVSIIENLKRVSYFSKLCLASFTALEKTYAFSDKIHTFEFDCGFLYLLFINTL